VAVDLRLIAAAMLINVDLERIGDLSEESPSGPSTSPSRRFADTGAVAAHDRPHHDDAASGAGRVRQPHKSQAQSVMRMDDEVDRYNEDIIREIVGEMKKSPP